MLEDKIKKTIKKTLNYFGYEIRKTLIGYKIIKISDYTKEAWKEETASEILFWEKWCKTEGYRWKEDFKTRNDPQSKLQDVFLNYIDRTQAKNKILDVGAGPLTKINKKCGLAEIEIYPTDPLADEYNKILKKYNIQPIITTQLCCGEKLTDKFRENTFDITYSCNAIDHSYDPLKCIEEMIKVTKNKHFIILQQCEKVGTNQSWSGLHKWDFFIEKGDLWLQSRDLKRINLTNKFKNTVELVQLTKKGGIITAEENLITAVFKKV